MTGSHSTVRGGGGEEGGGEAGGEEGGEEGEEGGEEGEGRAAEDQ